MFLANGHVVAVTTSGTSFSEQSRELRGLRIDCLDELLAYHALDGSMSRTGKRAKPRPDSGPDPRLGHLRQAVRLVREADALRRSGKYRSAAEKCEQALLLAPDYGGALLQRGKVYLYYLGTHWQELTAEERGRYALFAYQDSNRCEVMFPEWNEAWLVHGQNIIYVARLNSLPKGFQNARAKLEEMLGRDWPNPLTDSERSYAFNLRAQCHNFLGDMEQAEKDYAESILLAPDEPRWYLNRAQFWEQQGRPQLEKADREKAQALRRKRITASAQE